jgi:hypothetical protein
MLSSTVERTTTASRIIVRQEGVGLSMLRNVKTFGIKNNFLRDNKPLKLFFVTFVNNNSVTKIPCT